MPRRDDRLARRVAWLMLARVVLLLVVLSAVVVLGDLAGASAPRAEQGVLYAVVLGMAATVASGLALRWVRNPQIFGAIQATVDVAVTTAIVHLTGASNSVFAFLYVIVVAYVALIFDRRLSLAAAGLATLAYSSSLLAASRGLWLGEPIYPPPGLAVVLADAGVKAAALLVVAVLASGLAKELARADRALDERTRDFGRLRDLHELTVESLESGLLTVDPERIVRSFNREAERITGVNAAEALGRPLRAILPGAEALLGDPGRMRSRERMPYEGSDGGTLHLGLACSVLRDAEGRPSGHVIIFQDITAIVEMENELRRSERLAAVGELAAGIAHEVRNPLASISGSVQMLETGLAEEDHEQRRLMEIVLREADRLDALIRDFLHYARPTPPKPEAVEIGELVDEVCEMFETVREPATRLRCELEPGVRVFADADQLRQLLWNLLLNAAQAMEEGGEITLAARELPQEVDEDGRNVKEEGCARVEIAVGDTGPGIPPDVLDRIFDPFFTTKPAGSGLGLAMVHRIVEANEGSVSVDSEAGGGTRFRIRLPAAEDEG